MKLLDLYRKLNVSSSVLQNGFISYSVDPESTFRIALDHNYNPTILISENEFDSSNGFKSNYKLDKLEIQFNVSCNIKDLESQKESNQRFTIVKQINGNSRMHEYFLRIIEGIIQELQGNLSATKLNNEIEHLVRLFSSQKVSSDKTILGLWGELVFILNSSSIIESIDAWHIDRDNLYDFSFSTTNVEVKTTTRSTRRHEFNNSQLKSYKKLKVKIASIMTEKAALGRSIMELWQDILEQTEEPESRSKLSRVISETISQDVESLNQKKYNYNMAISTIKDYDSEYLPNIADEHIPQAISNVHVTLNLDSI